MDRIPTRRQNLDSQTESPHRSAFPTLGIRILEQYEIFEVNEGGFGYVLGMTDLRSGGKIAAKIPKPQFGRVSTLDEFTKEVTIWVDLPPHANIVTARFVKQVNGSPALFMDYVEGTGFRTIRELIRTGCVSLQTALDFGYQICLGMEAANRDREVVHMDLKPENLMVEHGKILRITDFGLAHRVKVINGAYERRYAGSWPYAAPERFAGEPCDARSDIYSLGVILYEMLTGGHYPYPIQLANDPAELYNQLRDFHASGGMDKVVDTMYQGGISGIEGRVGDVVSTFLNPSRGERSRGFTPAKQLLHELGAQSLADGDVSLSIADRLSRVEGFQAVGKHSQALSILNRLLMEEPENGALYLAAAKSLDATGDSKSAKNFRERALSILRSKS